MSVQNPRFLGHPRDGADHGETEALATMAAIAGIGDFPATAIESAKRIVTDYFACALGGRSMESSRSVERVMLGRGGYPESTIIGSGLRLPPASTAFINTHLANVLDADETIYYKGHVASVVVSSALALGEATRCTGAEFLTAVICGYEVASRIALSAQDFRVTDHGALEHSDVVGFGYLAIGGAAAAGRILKLDPSGIANTIGISTHMVPISLARRVGALEPPRPFTKYGMHAAYGEVGVTAAQLAQEGLAGDRSILDDGSNFWQSIGAYDSNPSILREGLEGRWLVEQAAYKWYPTVRSAAGVLGMYERIASDNALRAEDVDSVEAWVHPSARVMGSQNPDVLGEIDGIYSIPHQIACVAHKVPVGARWHSEEVRRNSEIAEFARRVSVVADPDISSIVDEQVARYGYYKRFPSRLKVMAKGRTFTEKCEFVFGDPWSAETTFTSGDFHDKLYAYSADSLSAAKASELLAILAILETEPDLSRLVELG